jgi:hypothetical protein
MKTTSYTVENGRLKKTVTDRRQLTPEDYRNACEIIKQAGRRYLASLKASRPLHESEHIALMNRVSRIFQDKHGCTASFSDWKVMEMTPSELQAVLDKQKDTGYNRQSGGF